MEPRGFLEVRGARLEYRWIAPSRTDVPTLVFLHEALGCVSMWRDFPDRLARDTGLGALVYSRAGYGRSSPAALPRPDDYLQREALEGLGPVLDAAGLEEVVLVGHSDGGTIALVHAGGADPRGRVRGVIAEAPHVFVEAITLAGIREARGAWERTDLRTRLARHHGDNVDFAFRAWNDTWLRPAYQRWNVEEFLPGVRAPVLVIQGLDDAYGSPEQVRRIERGVAGPAEALLIPGCGHVPHQQKAGEVLDAMAVFLKKILGPGVLWAGTKMTPDPAP